MAWTDPPTFVAGSNPRAAQLNILSDDLEFLYNPPRCAVRLSSTKVVSDGADTAIIWDQAVWDSTGRMFDPSSPTRVVARRAGVYSIQAGALFDDDAASGGIKRALFLHVNGTRRRGIQQAPSSPSEITASWETSLAEGDYIEVFTRQDSDGELNLQASRTVMVVRWVAEQPPFGQGE